MSYDQVNRLTEVQEKNSRPLPGVPPSAPPPSPITTTPSADTVAAGTTPPERTTYDGFDDIAYYQASTGTTTNYSYDPLNCVVSQAAGSTTAPRVTATGGRG
jgi:hypothetical protein